MSDQRHSGFELAPIYIARPVLGTDAIEALCLDLGLDGPLDPHVTVISSRAPVDWDDEAFSPDQDLIEIVPQMASIRRFGARGEFVALCLVAPEIEARHERLREKGASRDYSDFHPHISLAVNWEGALPDTILLKRPILLGPEDRKVPDFLADLPQEPKPSI
mgnify:CR=1 FL=1